MEGCKCKPAKSFAQRIIEYQEFVSLVKRMREAQMEFDKIYLEDYDNFMSWAEECDNREREVDEYLKKMEE